ncbi:hypothetical protein [Sphingomonas bacterium]|uniref:hypothetical protein n=1 Tax=Sphingomonas bacterium TaxID=1895847 RepID=UPI001576BA9D|nr:hypothetical protein [Sphingomonas bacterium]
MVTHVPPGDLDLQEQIARIRRTQEEVDKFSAETRRIVAEMTKTQEETRFLPIATIFQGVIAGAALMGAGAAIAKLFFP